MSLATHASELNVRRAGAPGEVPRLSNGHRPCNGDGDPVAPGTIARSATLPAASEGIPNNPDIRGMHGPKPFESAGIVVSPRHCDADAKDRRVVYVRTALRAGSWAIGRVPIQTATGGIRLPPPDHERNDNNG